MQVWNVLHAARWKYKTQKVAKIQDAKSRQKSPSGHHRTNLSGYIFATKARIDNQKKNSLSSNTCSTCPHNMANFGPLTAEIGWPVWGTPANFNGLRVVTALLHGTPVVGVSQTLRRWTEYATCIRQGDHHVGPWATFLVVTWYTKLRPYSIWRIRIWIRESSESSFAVDSLAKPEVTSVSQT